jgi:hypothetical protein
MRYKHFLFFPHNFYVYIHTSLCKSNRFDTRPKNETIYKNSSLHSKMHARKTKKSLIIYTNNFTLNFYSNSTYTLSSIIFGEKIFKFSSMCIVYNTKKKFLTDKKAEIESYMHTIYSEIFLQQCFSPF